MDNEIKNEMDNDIETKMGNEIGNEHEKIKLRETNNNFIKI